MKGRHTDHRYSLVFQTGLEIVAKIRLISLEASGTVRLQPLTLGIGGPAVSLYWV
jgi:hypothetical protein